MLKDADGRRHEIPLADIDEEIEGKSLMPKGLVKFMTHAEIVDLVAFLSQLGRPGQYAVRTTARMQRWRVLTNAAPELSSDVPNDEVFEDRVLAGEWSPIYARVDGSLPLDDVVRQAKSPIVYVRGEFDVQTAGPIGIRVDINRAVDDVDRQRIVRRCRRHRRQATAGRHSITLRIDATGHEAAEVRLELFKPVDSTAVFATVDGQ